MKREARRRGLAAKQDAAAREALARWNAASPAREAEDHPYLAAKGVGGYAVRVDRHSGHLLVPLRDETAAITRPSHEGVLAVHASWKSRTSRERSVAAILDK